MVVVVVVVLVVLVEVVVASSSSGEPKLTAQISSRVAQTLNFVESAVEISAAPSNTPFES